MHGRARGRAMASARSTLKGVAEYRSPLSPPTPTAIPCGLLETTDQGKHETTKDERDCVAFFFSAVLSIYSVDVPRCFGAGYILPSCNIRTNISISRVNTRMMTGQIPRRIYADLWKISYTSCFSVINMKLW